MRYKKFTIENYRAISGTMEINLEHNPLIPVIGINESGKTTILHAIFAFDFYNDKLNDDGRHLRDIQNLYETFEHQAVVSADIQLTRDEFIDALEEVPKLPATEASTAKSRERTAVQYRRKSKDIGAELTIRRNLKTKRYSIDGSDLFSDAAFNHLLSREIIRRLPYILFFDDFRDSVGERIEIETDEDGKPSGWLAIVEQLFNQN